MAKILSSNPLTNFLLRKGVNASDDRKKIKDTFNAKYGTSYKTIEEINEKEVFVKLASVVETLFQQGTFIKDKYSFNKDKIIPKKEQIEFLKKKGILQD